MCCFVCLGAARIALAVFSTSLTLFSHGSLWYWKEYNRSVLLGAVTFTMLPAGYLAARVSMNVSDRQMLSFAIAFTVFACCCLYQLGEPILLGLSAAAGAALERKGEGWRDGWVDG